MIRSLCGAIMGLVLVVWVAVYDGGKRGAR